MTFMRSACLNAQEQYDLLSEKLLAGAGIRLHTGKTRVWNQAGECPPGMGDFPPEVWSPEGMKILGTLLLGPRNSRMLRVRNASKKK